MTVQTRLARSAAGEFAHGVLRLNAVPPQKRRDVFQRLTNA
jgi:hypothetical protein